jgi:predicted O-methyltransferase YrrM
MMANPLLIKRFSILNALLFTLALTGILVYIARSHERALHARFIETLVRQNAPQRAVRLSDRTPPSPKAAYKGEYEFTEDWFTHHLASWRKATEPYAGKPGVKYLEVGVYEGRAAMWIAENVLTDPTSELVGLDLFSGDYVDAYGPYEQRYRNNVRKTGLGDRATTIKGYSQVELRKLPLAHYDIIYVDGSHVNANVLEDAILVWRLLKDGGLLIFDDYGNQGTTDPRIGVDTFMRFFGRHFEVIHNDLQLMMRKKSAAPV